MPRRLAALCLALAVLAPLPLTGIASAEGELFTKTMGFATKTGQRAVFAWEAAEPVLGVVHYGPSPDDLGSTISPLPGTPDTAQMAIADLEQGQIYYWQVEDTLSGERSAIASIEMRNAFSDWDGSTYTLDLLIQLDSESLPPDVPHDMALQNIAQGVNIFAERLYDALDGHARLGNVLITDTNLDYAANIPAAPVVCSPGSSNAADVLVQTTVPMDSHTFLGGIEDPCIGFYVGRLGQLVNAFWGITSDEDLHFGYVATHEMMHYAFFAPDLYPEAPNGGGGDCRNLEWDGSLMHNTGGWDGKWLLTELDRNPSLTPCNHGTNDWTWDMLREKYINVPLRPEGPIEHMFDSKPRGNEDGGALEINILDRQQATASSTLTPFTPLDGVVECGPTLPVLNDPEGDATGLVVPNAMLPSEPSLDVTEATLTWDEPAQTVDFHIAVSDLTDAPPVGGTGKTFRFDFAYAGESFQLQASRDDLTGEETFVLAYLVPDGITYTAFHTLEGSFDADADEVTIRLPVDEFNEAVAAFFQTLTPPREPPEPPLSEGALLEGFDITAQRRVGVPGVQSFTLTADVATGSCPYVVGQESVRTNTAPVAEDDSARTRKNRAVKIAVLANDSDPDGDDLVIDEASEVSARRGRVTVNDDGTMTYKPRRRFSGTDTFGYTITDGFGGTDTAIVTVRVRR